MTIRELKDILDGVSEEHLDEQVYMLIQPNWPFVYSVSNADYIPSEDFTAESPEEETVENPRPGLYLAEGSQLDYARQVELDHFGWRE